MERQTLEINGIPICFYEINGDCIFIKVSNTFKGKPTMVTEDWCIEVIERIECKKFIAAGYLNI
ncbi:MAG: hypothetical protein ABIN74_11820 [Ferruginibacter sp.]